MSVKFIENGSITSVNGFNAAGIHCGLKKQKKDLALIQSEQPCTAAGTFTLNKVKAAPLIISQDIIKNGNSVKAVLVNSGNANAATGIEGYQNAKGIQEYCAAKLDILPEEVLISSTGVIGQQIDTQKVKNGIDTIIPKLNDKDGIEAAEAIMTTDLVSKHYAVEFEISGQKLTIGGICKGSGMIMPNMATMLAFIGTDAKIDTATLKETLKHCVDNSFNKISVDGDTSTNDMVILMANGSSGVEIKDTVDYYIFTDALMTVCKAMAKSIVADGEGATKVVEVKVNSALNEEEANKAAKSIVNSPLVKTAIAGADANWGRILSAIGNSGIEFQPEETEIMFNDIPILEKNFISKFDEETAKKIMLNPEYSITVNLNKGNESTVWWTSDLTEEYIKINASYRS